MKQETHWLKTMGSSLEWEISPVWQKQKRNSVIRHILQEEKQMKYICDVCGWEYDEEKGYPEGGIAPDTKWEDLPEDFTCPLCSVGKDQFSEA